MTAKKIIPTLLMLLVLALQACGNKTKTTSHTQQAQAGTVLQDTLKSSIRPGEKIGLGKIYTDTVQFIRFNDDGDYWLLFAKKNKDTVSLIYDGEYHFTRGDEIEIKWKIDSLRPAGDPEFLSFTEFLTAAKTLKPLALTDKKIKFLWRETRYSEQYKTDISTIILNEAFIKNISEPEKAALAYVATFIGNECEWDGKANDDRSNLKCKILSALGLGYQCSQQHLGFLRHWFRSNKDILKELDNCPTTPDGATIQDTFDEITLEVKNNRITVSFKATAINVREEKSKRWTEKQYFDFKENELFLIKKEISPIIQEKAASDSLINSVQKKSAFTGNWQNSMVFLNISESTLVFLYHGQCAYFYPIKKISDAEFEMIWTRDMDCKFDNGTAKTFGLKNVPALGKPFAKFTLKNKVLHAQFYYKEWVKRYTDQVKKNVFTNEYTRRNENY